MCQSQINAGIEDLYRLDANKVAIKSLLISTNEHAIQAYFSSKRK